MEQGNLFGSIKPTSRKQINVLISASVRGVDQPFEMDPIWGSSYTTVTEMSNVVYVDKLIRSEPIKQRGKGFRSSFYRFMSAREPMGAPQIVEDLEKTSLRATWFEEGVALIEKFKQFPTNQKIWVLDAGFRDGLGRSLLTLVLCFERGWHLHLGHPAYGEIRNNDLILVHCDFK